VRFAADLHEMYEPEWNALAQLQKAAFCHMLAKVGNDEKNKFFLRLKHIIEKEEDTPQNEQILVKLRILGPIRELNICVKEAIELNDQINLGNSCFLYLFMLIY
jgi:hypothetical protein